MSGLATKRNDDALLKPVVGAVDWLGFAAAPTFALMAGVSAVSSSGTTICSVAWLSPPLNEMVPMYLLMSLFHLSPWLKFLSHRRSAPVRNPN